MLVDWVLYRFAVGTLQVFFGYYFLRGTISYQILIQQQLNAIRQTPELALQMLQICDRSIQNLHHTDHHPAVKRVQA
jgi:hypothetical protein